MDNEKLEFGLDDTDDIFGFTLTLIAQDIQDAVEAHTDNTGDTNA